MMLNAHHDTDVNDNEKVQRYEEALAKWKKRGNCPGLRNVEDGNRGGGSNPTPSYTISFFSDSSNIYLWYIWE